MLLYFFSRYTAQLHSQPILTKALTAATLTSIGDSIAQWAQFRKANDPSQEYNPLVHQNFRRTLGMMFYGAAFVTPFSHKWYRFLDGFVKMPSNLSKFSPRAFGLAIKRVCLDQIFAAPIFISGMFTTRGIISGSSMGEISDKLQQDYFRIFKAGLTVWPTVQFLNMWFVPLPFRVLVCNIVSLGWTIFTSSSVQYEKEQLSTLEDQQDANLDDLDASSFVEPQKKNPLIHSAIQRLTSIVNHSSSPIMGRRVTFAREISAMPA